MRLLALLVLFVSACGGGLAPPDHCSTKPVTGAGFIGVEVAHGTTAVTVAIDCRATLVDALFAPATCLTLPPPLMKTASSSISAGTLEIDDLTQTVLQPQLDGSYPDPGASSTVDLVPGGTIDVTATGGDIPAFAASLDAPAKLSIQTPDPDKAPGMRPVAQDLSVTWLPQPDSTVRATLYANDLVLACDFASELGKGTLPGAQIAEMGPSDANLVVRVRSSTSLTSGAVPIELGATLDALGPGSQPYLYAFTLQ